MKVWLPCIATGTGAEVWTRRLAAGLAARGHAVQLDRVSHRYQYAPWLAPVRAPSGCDVVLANSWTGTAFAGPAPLVTVVHHVVHDPALLPFKTAPQAIFHRLFVEPMERAAIRAASAVVAVSPATANAVERYLGFAGSRVVLNGVDIEAFTPDDTRSRPNGAPLELLFVGKPSRRKGFDIAAEIVRRLGAECRFVCIGGEPERGLQMPPGEYLGRVDRDRLIEAYRSADALLMPSRLEGFGYAAAEAMACGTPVVACRGTAVSDIVPCGGGVICDAGDIDGFVAGIRELVPSDSRLQSALRKHAADRLSEQRWLDEMEDTLLSVSRLDRTEGETARS